MSEPGEFSIAECTACAGDAGIASLVIWFSPSTAHTIVKDRFQRVIQFKATNGDSLKIDYDEGSIKQVRNKHGSPILNGTEKCVHIDEQCGAVEIDLGDDETETHYVGSSTVYKYKDGSKEVIASSGAVFKFRRNQHGCDGLVGIYTVDGRYFRVRTDSHGKHTANCTVQPGDSLYRIAEDWLIHGAMPFDDDPPKTILRETLRKAVQIIAEANGIDAPDRIYAGQNLWIPSNAVA